LDRLAGADANIRQKLKILAISRNVPENGLALRAKLPASLKTSLQNALLNMQQDPIGNKVLFNFGALRFVRTTNHDYEPVLNYVREAGLDLARYDYVNH
jgi:ABC-type phosphate/phosphonate transport system substrate-binding protein